MVNDQTPYLEFFVEEQSMGAALSNILPKIYSDQTACWVIREFNGKTNLLKNLPYRLRGRRKSMQRCHKIIVMVDRDRDDCHELKGKLETIASREGLITKTSAPGGNYQVINRIVIEELEAWFFGDPNAIIMAYPRVTLKTLSKPAYRNPDNIIGGTWEALEKILISAGYYSTGMPKKEVAEKVSRHMNININSSHSFNVFVEGIRNARLPE
ncbi:MAG: DUF4276 family protein [Methanomassiliicoccales archaeon]|nr:DUF4276 family protein [Methanomassiliicoccales archaeon]